MNVSAAIFRHRSTVLLVLVAPLVWGALAGVQPTLPAWIGGGVIAAAGVLLRLTAMRCLGRGARVHRAGVRGQLVTWGPYAWSRNPLYVAAALILAGVGVVAGWEAWGLLLFPAAMLVYTPIVLHEERAIEGDVGEEFREYKASVPRWLGLPGPRPADIERVPWGEVLSREKGLVPGVALGLGAVGAITSGVIPVREWFLQLSGGRVAPPVIGLIVLTLGALGNAISVERKRLRRIERDRRREAGGGEPAPAEGALAAPAEQAAEVES